MDELKVGDRVLGRNADILNFKGYVAEVSGIGRTVKYGIKWQNSCFSYHIRKQLWLRTNNEESECDDNEERSSESSTSSSSSSENEGRNIIENDAISKQIITPAPVQIRFRFLCFF
jgi:hypothetical protein